MPTRHNRPNENSSQAENLPDFKDRLALFDQVGQGMIYQSTDGIIIKVNRSAEHIFGQPEHELLGLKITDARWKTIQEDGMPLDDEDHPAMLALRTGVIVSDVVLGIYNQKKERHDWIKVTAVPEFKPGENKPYQVYTIVIDVGKQKQIEHDLNERIKELHAFYAVAERPQEDNGSFLKEERFLLDSVAERRQTTALLEQRNEFHELAMQAAGLGRWQQNFQTQQFILDETARRHFGLNTGEISSRDILDRIHPADSQRVADEFKSFFDDKVNGPIKTEYRIVHPDGTIIWLAIDLIIQFGEADSGGIPLSAVGTTRDITKRKLVEETLNRKTRALTMLSACNQALMKMSNEMELLHEICRICIEDGNYRMAWVGYVEQNPEKIIRPVAQCGFDTSYLDTVKITWDDSESGRGPTGMAVQTNRTVIAQDIPLDAELAPWREAADQGGHGSSIALPIRMEGIVIGVLTIYSGDPGAFQADEVELIKELASDLSYGIETLRMRAKEKSLELDLMKSEGRFKLAQQTAHVGSWEWDIRENVFFWSDETYYLFDKTPLDFKPGYTTMIDCVIPEDRLRIGNAIENAFATGIPFDVEFRIQDSAGLIRWLYTKGNVIQNTAGQPELAAGTIQDVTHHKQMEDMLRMSEEQFRSAFDQAAIGMCMISLDGLFLRANPTLCQMVGYTQQELMEKTVFQVTHPDDLAAIKERMGQLLDHKLQAVQFEERYLRPDGQIIWTSISSSLVFNSLNEPAYFIDQVQDISERKNTEKALEEERNLFDVLMNNIPSAIYFKDLNSRFIRANLALAQHFGLEDPTKLLGKMDFDFFAEEHARSAYNDEQSIIQSGQPLIDLEEEEVWPDGRKAWATTTKMPLRNSAGQIVGTFGISHNITQRKQMELALQQRLMEMETVNQLTLRLRGGDTVRELLQILIDETLKTINTRDGGIFLFEPSSSKLELSVSRGWFDQLAGLKLDPGEGINGHVYATNQPYITYEMQGDPLLAREVEKLIPPGQCGGFFPIQSSEGIIGVLDVYVPQPRTITENDQRLLAIISQLAGNGILRSRLNEQLKLSNIELQNEIHQRNAVQEMLAAEKGYLSSTLMSIAEGVIITDKEGLIVLFNRAAESLTGHSALDVIGQPVQNILKLIDHQTKEVISDLIKTLYEMDQIEENDPNYKPPLLITKSNEKILVAGSISLLKSPSEEVMGHVLAFQNITEKHKAGVQTALSQKMEAIGQLAAGIAHEINTPIQYIGDNLRFLQKTIARFTDILQAIQSATLEPEKPLSQEDVNHLNALLKQGKIEYYVQESPNAVQEALDGVERVRKIVLAMREFSHPSEKEKKLSDVNHGIETTVVISRNEWKYIADLDTVLDPNLQLVNCQIDEINQVILNMIVNAAQAIQEKTPAGSEHKGKISISTHQGENHILIKIGDTGKGMPEAVQQRIFDPFFTTKGVGKGTGQGLSMAHNIIVKKHCGKITVDSVEGEGTTFTIELPLNSPNKCPADSKQESR